MITTSVTSTLDILRAARELISTPEKWTQGAFARNRKGLRTGPLSTTARCFCTAGALHRAGAFHMAGANFEIVDMFDRAIGDVGILGWNDTPGRTHAEVLNAFDRAIALAEQANP